MSGLASSPKPCRFFQRLRQRRHGRRRCQITRRKTGQERIIRKTRLERRFGAGERRACAFEVGMRQRHVCPRDDADFEPVFRRTDLLVRDIDIVLADRHGFAVSADIHVSRDDLKDQVLRSGLILRICGTDPSLGLTDAGGDAAAGIDRLGRLDLRGERAGITVAHTEGRVGVGILVASRAADRDRRTAS
jgi:hypothetical protein